jgi:ferredoxin
MQASRRRVHVNPRLCEGHALCVDLAPQVFDLTDDDRATCDAQPPGDLWDEVTAAVNACPRGAITVEVPQDRVPSESDRKERAT